MLLFLSNPKSDPFPRVHLNCLNKSSGGRRLAGLHPLGPGRQERRASPCTGDSPLLVPRGPQNGSSDLGPSWAGAGGSRPGSRSISVLLWAQVHEHRGAPTAPLIGGEAGSLLPRRHPECVPLPGPARWGCGARTVVTAAAVLNVKYAPGPGLYRRNTFTKSFIHSTRLCKQRPLESCLAASATAKQRPTLGSTLGS